MIAVYAGEPDLVGSWHTVKGEAQGGRGLLLAVISNSTLAEPRTVL